MAKKKIDKNDIAPIDLFDNIKLGAEKTKEKILALKTAIDALNTAAKKIKGGVKGAKATDTKGMRDFDALTKKANATATAKLKIDKQLIHQKEHLRRLQALQNKETKLTIELRKSEVGSLNRIRAVSKKLIHEKNSLNLKTKAGTRRLKEINRQLDKNNKILDKNATKLGKQKNNIGNYGSAISRLRSGLMRLGLAFGVFSLLRNTFKTVRDFGQAQANLASVLGETKDAAGQWSKSMTTLVDQSKELGATTTFTASQVSELQLSLAKLGFDRTEIQNMTQATLELAEATGTELAEAATVTGSTLRAFNLDSNQTQRVVDVMAKSFSSSSLDMTKFSTAMATVAPVANAMGFSVERTTALIGTMTDSGVEASTAGTGLRNMFLNAKKHGLTLDEALAKIANSSDKVGTSFDLFGKRGSALGVILAQNRDVTNELNTKLLFADDSAKQMADTQRDTLGGSVKLLQSAWEGFVLKLEEGTGVFSVLKDVLKFVAENLDTIVKVLAVVATAFGVYKLINLTTKAVKSLSLAMSANPLGLIVAAAAAAVVAIQAFSTALSKAERAAQALKDVELEAAKAVVSQKEELKRLVEVAQDKAKTDKEREQAIQAINDISPEMLGNIDLENILTEEGAAIIGNYVKALEKKALAEAINAKLVSLNIELLETQASSIQENVGFWEQQWAIMRSGGVLNPDEFESALSETAKANRKDKIAGINAEIDALMNKAKAEEIAGSISGAAGGGPQGGTVVDDTGAGSVSGRLKKVKDLTRLIEDEQIKQIKNAEERELLALSASTERRIKDLDKNVHEEGQKAKLIVEIEKNFLIKIQKITDKFAKKKKEKKAAAVAAQKKIDKEILDAEKAEIAQLDVAFTRSMKVKELELLKSGKTQEQIAKELLDFEIDLLAKRIINFKLMFPLLEDEIRDMEIKYEKLLDSRDSKVLNKTKKTEDELAKLKEQAIEHTTDLLIAQIDKRIKKIDEESDAHKKKADFLRELAKNGNISAKESLAEQNRIIAEAEAEKERLEKRKQRVLLVSSILQAYNAELAIEGTTSAEALTKAITSKVVLDQFIAGIGSFFDGTEDTGLVSNGMDANGGRLAVLHNNERVMTAKQNAKIGDYTNDQVARIVEERRLGNIVGDSQIGNGWDSHLVVQELMEVSTKLDQVNKTIENKETNRIELGEITQSAMKIVETRQKGLNRTVSTYKIQ